MANCWSGYIKLGSLICDLLARTISGYNFPAPRFFCAIAQSESPGLTFVVPAACGAGTGAGWASATAEDGAAICRDGGGAFLRRGAIVRANVCFPATLGSPEGPCARSDKT